SDRGAQPELDPVGLGIDSEMIVGGASALRPARRQTLIEHDDSRGGRDWGRQGKRHRQAKQTERWNPHELSPRYDRLFIDVFFLIRQSAVGEPIRESASLGMAVFSGLKCG